jgi:hypothetical protein
VTTPATPKPPDKAKVKRPNLIDEARRHQRRRRQIIGAFVFAPVAIGALIVGLNLGDSGTRGGVAARSPASSKWHPPQAEGEKLPSTLSPPNVVVLNPATGEVVAASESEQSAAALRAVQGAVAAQTARVSGSGQLEQIAQAQRAAAAAAAATQSGHQ